jgi:hypothetical protein
MLPARLSLLVVSCLLVSAPARAQVYFVAYLGTNVTHRADVTVDSASPNLAVTFHEVAFVARPFEAPQYYGGRFGWLFKARQVGLEAEFIHMKMYADTTRAYPVTGVPGLPSGESLRMDTLVQRYAMSHGLNYLLGNLVIRRPVHDRVALVARGGAGVTIPHAESTVLGVARDLYEYAGPGVHAAAGVDWQIHGPLSVVGEYKLTWAKPEISVASGTGRTTALTHHFAFGVGIGFAR